MCSVLCSGSMDLAGGMVELVSIRGLRASREPERVSSDGGGLQSPEAVWYCATPFFRQCIQSLDHSSRKQEHLIQQALPVPSSSLA